MTLAGRASVHMKKIVSAENIDLISRNLPSYERSLEQPVSLLWILYIMGNKSSIFGLVVLIGNPR